VREDNLSAAQSVQATKCLHLGDGNYVLPTHVFRVAHRFGQYRHVLPAALADCPRLLDVWKVRPSPEWDDAFGVLRDISAEPGRESPGLPQDVEDIVMECWRLLERGLMGRQTNEARIKQELHARHVVPVGEPGKRQLVPPQRVLMVDREDLRTLLAESGPYHAMQGVKETRPYLTSLTALLTPRFSRDFTAAPNGTETPLLGLPTPASTKWVFRPLM
jgi:hypothetical protein